ncbi:hypothetical protein Q8F55_002555 [Vanrija albida]|uniref:MAPEG family protein n=1 Tax=Vanrija albida TaxID=181172 RepID=A0ABR3QA92_9TREE
MVHVVGIFHTSTNYSLFAVPAAFGLAFAPHLYAVCLLNFKHAPNAEGFDFSNPKNSRANIHQSGLSVADQDRYLRAEAANDNGFLGLPFFAAAVVAGNAANLDLPTLNGAAAVYIGSRIAFNYLYIFGTNSEYASAAPLTADALGLARTVSWFTGIGACLHLFYKAAYHFQPLIEG